MKPRRFIRLFKGQFAPSVAQGLKLQTVRPRPARMPAAGDIQINREWTGKPYRSKQRDLSAGIITGVKPIEIYGDSIQLDGRRLTSLQRDEFAVADGFPSFAEMADWFRQPHDLPFEGVVIHWHAIATVFKKATGMVGSIDTGELVKVRHDNGKTCTIERLEWKGSQVNLMNCIVGVPRHHLKFGPVTLP